MELWKQQDILQKKIYFSFLRFKNIVDILKCAVGRE